MSNQRGAPLSITTSSGQVLPAQPQPYPPYSPSRSTHASSPSATHSPYPYSPSPISSPSTSHPTSHPQPSTSKRRATEPFKGATSPRSPLGALFRKSSEPPKVTSPSLKRLSEGNVQVRRNSGEKVNVYTECGRHSDEWLFGPMKGAVKRMWEREREEKGKDGEDEGKN
ncbi:hypothetical protein BJ875DRAFT_295652 [Amylocarpus encephaloides]|uniref:Uncharacterized protein n=1 Tax=Amylocarpus encephaloides TaxID=45428 RepID=A0A9P7YJ88_9HELO|nr:hypothetical protein BJ875DRAFT_295652 [Amylocarpus encephaloides]